MCYSRQYMPKIGNIAIWNKNKFYAHCSKTIDTRTALIEIIGEDMSDWIHGYGSACPESIKRDGSIGYVYTGGGLTIEEVIEHDALILFCPGENHRGSSEHCHAYHGAGNDICKSSNQDMIKLLKSSLSKAEDGVINYSAEAVEIMKNELTKRTAKF